MSWLQWNYSSQYFYYVFKIRWYGYECRHGYHVWRPKDYLCRLIPSYHLGAGDWIQVTRLGCKCLYLLSHLTVPKTFCLFKSRGISGTNGKNTNVGACSGKTEQSVWLCLNLVIPNIGFVMAATGEHSCQISSLTSRTAGSEYKVNDQVCGKTLQQ